MLLDFTHIDFEALKCIDNKLLQLQYRHYNFLDTPKTFHANFTITTCQGNHNGHEHYTSP